MSSKSDWRDPAIYIMASGRNGILYTGVTSTLLPRVWEHKTNARQGFTSRHKVHMLVYYEQHCTMSDAISREKQIKAWKREWKLRLIEEQNPQWADLAADSYDGYT